MTTKRLGRIRDIRNRRLVNGRLQFWGFITESGTHVDRFFQSGNVLGRREEFQQGREVRFTPGPHFDGDQRLRASQVELVREEAR